MKERCHSDIWTFHQEGSWIVIPTNTDVKANGLAVMGAGLAKQAAYRFPHLAGTYGEYLNHAHTHAAKSVVYPDAPSRTFLFPTKHHWNAVSTLSLIRANASDLARLYVLLSFWNPTIRDHPVYLPPLGCGLGGLDYPVVYQELATRLSDNFVSIRPRRSPALGVQA